MHAHPEQARKALTAGPFLTGRVIVNLPASHISNKVNMRAVSGIDALTGLAIAALVVPRTWSLLRQAGDILLESAPAGLEPERIQAAAREVENVLALHDVHVWAIAPSFPALSAHVELNDVHCTEHILTDLATLFRERFGIGHVTLQPETPALHEAMECCLSPDTALLAKDLHAHGGTLVR